MHSFSLLSLSRCFATISLAALVSSCGANHHSIYRGFNVSPPFIRDEPHAAGRIVDAKQRAIIATRRHDGANDIYAFCVEPNPDVFSVFSSSMAASGRFSGAKANKELVGEIAKNLSENGSTISRTQTIQILREIMYRTCEKYINGGMDPDEISIQAMRDQRTIVSILAIEQLTGVQYAPTVALSAVGTADTGKMALEIQKNLEGARKKESSKKDEVDKADKALKKTQKELKDTQDARSSKDDERKAEKAKEKPDAAKISAFDKAIGELDTKIAELKEKEKTQSAAHDTAKKNLSTHQELISSLEKKLEAAMSVAVGGSTKVDFSGCKDCKPAPLPKDSIEEIADAVTAIVDRTFELDEVEIRCLRTLQSPPERLDGSISSLEAEQKTAITQIQDAYQKSMNFCYRYLENKNREKEQELATELAKNPKAQSIFESMRDARKTR